MSVPVIKAITRRIRMRYGSSELAAQAAGLSNKGAWSLYESPDHPETTIPIHRLLIVAEGDERRAIAALFTDEPVALSADLNTEASETIESAAELGKMVRLAAVDGVVTETEARPIRAKALETIAQAGDVLKALG